MYNNKTPLSVILSLPFFGLFFLVSIPAQIAFYRMTDNSSGYVYYSMSDVYWFGGMSLIPLVVALLLVFRVPAARIVLVIIFHLIPIVWFGIMILEYWDREVRSMDWIPITGVSLFVFGVSIGMILLLNNQNIKPLFSRQPHSPEDQPDILDI